MRNFRITSQFCFKILTQNYKTLQKLHRIRNKTHHHLLHFYKNEKNVCVFFKSFVLILRKKLFIFCLLNFLMLFVCVTCFHFESNCTKQKFKFFIYLLFLIIKHYLSFVCFWRTERRIFLCYFWFLWDRLKPIKGCHFLDDKHGNIIFIL